MKGATLKVQAFKSNIHHILCNSLLKDTNLNCSVVLGLSQQLLSDDGYDDER
jgi:hypothetical protein